MLVTAAPLMDAALPVNSAMGLLLVAVKMAEFYAVKPVFPKVLPAAPRPRVHSVSLGPSVSALPSAMVLKEVALVLALIRELQRHKGVVLATRTLFLQAPTLLTVVAALALARVLVIVLLVPHLLQGLEEALLLLLPVLAPSTRRAYCSVSWLPFLSCYKLVQVLN